MRHVLNLNFQRWFNNDMTLVRLKNYGFLLHEITDILWVELRLGYDLIYMRKPLIIYTF